MICIPQKLLERYREMISPDSFQEFLKSFDAPVKKSLRLNSLRLSKEEFLEMAKNLGWELSPIPLVKEGFFIDRENRDIPLGKTLPHITGLLYLQEASSMLSSTLLAPKRQELVLDMAASPGSKTTHMAMMMENTGFILANDLSSKRISGLISNLKRLNIANTAVTRKNAIIFGKIFPNTFDKVLLDAPCTGEGLIRKDFSVFEKWSLANIKIMAGIQKKLIESAFMALKTGGEMVYSTCTLAPEENEEVLDFLLKRFGDILEVVDLQETLKNEGIAKETLKNICGLTSFEGKNYSKEVKKALRIWPHIFHSEGFFIAKIRKLKKTGEGSFGNKKVFKTDIKRVLKFLGKKEIKSIESFVKKQFGYEISLEKNYEVVKIHHEIYIRSYFSEKFYSAVSFEYNGLPIFFDARDTLIISHEAAMLWGKYFTKRVISLTEEQKNEYFRGKDIVLPPSDILKFSDDFRDGTVILRYDNMVIGKGLLKENKIKNQLPRELVISQ